MSLSFYVERRNMTGKTHVVGGNVFALGSYILMKKTGLLVDSVWEPLQLGIILPYATWASTLPDLDQNNKNRVETNPVNTAIQDLFRVIQAGHRSVKSHVAPCIIVGVLCVMSILGKSFFNLNQISTNILFLVLTGLFCGLLSHLILDLCTSDGIVIAGKRITMDGTSSSDYGDNVSINYSYESSTGCSYTSLKVLLLNNVGEVLGYGIGFVNDVPVGENVTSTMYAIAAPHSLDSLADMAMFSCPTLE